MMAIVAQYYEVRRNQYMEQWEAMQKQMEAEAEAEAEKVEGEQMEEEQ